MEEGLRTRLCFDTQHSLRVLPCRAAFYLKRRAESVVRMPIGMSNAESSRRRLRRDKEQGLRFKYKLCCSVTIIVGD